VTLDPASAVKTPKGFTSGTHCYIWTRRVHPSIFSATQDQHDGWTFCMCVASKIAQCAWRSY